MISGGITNNLFLVRAVEPTPDDPAEIPATSTLPPVVLRVFGRGTDAFLDRAVEADALLEFNAQGFGATCLGVFRNGRLEERIPDVRPLEPEEMALPAVSNAIAAVMRRFHACDVPARGRSPGTWDVLRDWWRLAGRAAEETSRDGLRETSLLRAFGELGTLVGTLGDVIDALERECASVASPTVTLHNDALSGNFLVPADWRPTGPDDPPPTTRLIDFEYACVGPRGFDVANHFAEYAGFECDWSKLPNERQRERFCAAYVEAEATERVREGDARTRESNSNSAAEDASKSALALAREAEAFAPVTHLWWGLWAVMRAANQSEGEGEGDGERFDYAAYAERRLFAFRASRAAYTITGGGVSILE